MDMDDFLLSPDGKSRIIDRVLLMKRLRLPGRVSWIGAGVVLKF